MKKFLSGFVFDEGSSLNIHLFASHPLFHWGQFIGNVFFRWTPKWSSVVLSESLFWPTHLNVDHRASSTWRLAKVFFFLHWLLPWVWDIARQSTVFLICLQQSSVYRQQVTLNVLAPATCLRPASHQPCILNITKILENWIPYYLWGEVACCCSFLINIRIQIPNPELGSSFKHWFIFLKWQREH